MVSALPSSNTILSAMPGQLSTEGALPRIPRCIFPSFRAESKPDTDLKLRETDVSFLPGRWDAVESSFKDKGITLPTVLKAAWALTLQCYVSSELLCFEYHGPHHTTLENGSRTNGVDNHVLKNRSVQCLLRLDDTEDLLAFLGRLEKGQQSTVPFVPTGSGILFVSPVTPADFCNTTVLYRDADPNVNGSYQDVTLEVIHLASRELYTPLISV